jgi:predicted alpha/beta superfamily hydrolase
MPFRRVPRLRTFALACALLLPSVLIGQAPPSRTIALGEAHIIRSAVLDEERELQVSLPVSYGRTTIKYPVLFMLDGSSHLLHATATVRFLANARERAPEMIIVAVPNRNRNRDLTPGPGAVRFQRFIAEELIPWVERTYRAAPDRILMGHSLSGSFTVHTMLNRPELFRAYIVASAPLWRYDSLVQQARPGLARAGAASAEVFLTVGEHENLRLKGSILAFSALIDSLTKARTAAPVKWFALLPDEDHSSTPSRTLYAALEERYRPWRVPFFEEIAELEAVGGVEGLETHYRRFSAHFGYEAPPPMGRLTMAGRILIDANRRDEVRRIAERYKDAYPAMAEQLLTAAKP